MNYLWNNNYDTIDLLKVGKLGRNLYSIIGLDF